jgi:hypothetical protein
VVKQNVIVAALTGEQAALIHELRAATQQGRQIQFAVMVNAFFQTFAESWKRLHEMMASEPPDQRPYRIFDVGSMVRDLDAYHAERMERARLATLAAATPAAPTPIAAPAAPVSPPAPAASPAALLIPDVVPPIMAPEIVADQGPKPTMAIDRASSDGSDRLAVADVLQATRAPGNGASSQ